MKVYHYLIIASLLVITVLTGCKYDVKQPGWDTPPGPGITPTITGITPAAEAVPGVNTITIHGGNFVGITDTNGVQFDNVLAEVIQKSTTDITVRRPNLVAASCTVIVVSDSSYYPVKYYPYKIDAVQEQYGSYVANLQLAAVAVDSSENIYVTEYASRKVTKVTPGGQKTDLAVPPRLPTDVRIGPNGKLYLIGNGPSSGNRDIQVVNTDTGGVKVWYHAASGATAFKFGDFDASGYLYVGGAAIDITIIAPDSTSRLSGIYASSEILAVRVYNGYLYVAERTGNNTNIWRHAISAGGTLGTKELVLDWSTTGQFASTTIRGFALSSGGTLFVETNNANNAFVVVTAQGTDFFYKGILPSSCGIFDWRNYLYVVSGDGTAGNDYTLYRVDMGIASARR